MSGPELTAKLLRNDLEDCTEGDDNDGGSWSPIFPVDPDVLAPLNIDLIPESRRQEFAPRAAACGVKIDLFFRPDDDLGHWNDPAQAAQELREALDRCKEIKPSSPLTTPIPHIPKDWDKGWPPSGNGGGGGDNIGGRSIPR